MYDVRFGSSDGEDVDNREKINYAAVDGENFANQEGFSLPEENRIPIEKEYVKENLTNQQAESTQTSSHQTTSQENKTSETVSDQLRASSKPTKKPAVISRKEGPISPTMDNLPNEFEKLSKEEKVERKRKKVARWALTPSKEDIDDFWGSRTFLVKSFFKRADVSSHHI